MAIINTISSGDALRRGENRTLRFTYLLDDESEIVAFGSRDFEFFWLDPAVAVPANLTELRTDSLVDLTDILTTDPPYVDVLVGPGDWPDAAGTYNWELWRVDGPNVYSVARGTAVIA